MGEQFDFLAILDYEAQKNAAKRFNTNIRFEYNDIKQSTVTWTTITCIMANICVYVSVRVIDCLMYFPQRKPYVSQMAKVTKPRIEENSEAIDIQMSTDEGTEMWKHSLPAARIQTDQEP